MAPTGAFFLPFNCLVTIHLSGLAGICRNILLRGLIYNQTFSSYD